MPHNAITPPPVEITKIEFRHNMPFECRNGWKARLVGILDRTAFPLVVAIMNPMFQAEEVLFFDLDGIQPSANNMASKTNKEDLGVMGGPLSLVNTNYEEWAEHGDEMVNSFTRDLEPIPAGEMPWHHEHILMYSQLVRGWYAMHNGYDSDETKRALPFVVLCNLRSGQRIHVDLRSKKAHKETAT